MIFLGREINEEKDYSEHTAEAIDKEVSKFIEEAYNTAERILTEKRIVLENLVAVLMEKETIEREEYNELVGVVKK
jgi:cell division protease FtsH